MRRATIDANGRLDLGEQAQIAGYTPGTVVDIRVASSNSLHVTITDPSEIIDLPPVKPLPADRARLAIAGRSGPIESVVR